MKAKLLEILVCPECKGELLLKGDVEEMGEIKEGKLVCKSCASKYVISKYIPRFVSGDEYVNNFSFEWNKHRQTQLDSVSGTDESERTFRQKTGFTPGELRGKLVLDVGCGSGRFMEVVAKYGGHIVGIDLSFAVDAAFKNMGFNKNVNIIQADIFSLPFKEGTFDYIFSIGVLHHTPNTKMAFQCIPKFLKNGGEIAIWVYSNEGFLLRLFNIVSAVYRFFTTRMSQRLVYRLSYVSVPLYYPKKIPVIGHFLRMILPTSPYPIREWRVLDTFDWYSPKYQWKHTYSEVLKWFGESGLEEVKRLEVPVSVKGRR